MAARGKDEGAVNAWAPLRASKAMAIGAFMVDCFDTIIIAVVLSMVLGDE